MAGNSEQHFNPPSYLTPGQEDLLMAALASNNPAAKASDAQKVHTSHQATASGWDQNGFGFDVPDSLSTGLDTGGHNLSLSSLDGLNGNLEDSSFLNFLENNGDDEEALGFNIQDGDIGDDLDDDESPEGETESHEKRKNPEDADDVEGNDPKRREPGDKVPKKPGRKPLTTEPTNKRKAQNRAAQRAFRERKEKHLKDLETKVAELEKASESKNSENTLLRAQVTRLQTELREYRKRLSLTGGTLGQSPALSNGLSSFLASNAVNTNFSFDFPRFGSLPNSGFVTTPPETNVVASPASITNNTFSSAIARQSSGGNQPSPRNPSRANSAPSNTQSPPQHNGSGVQIESINNEGLNGLFGGRGSGSRSTSMDTVAPHTRIFQFNSNANSTASPSNSSNSQYGASSSCGTSPEPFHNSPAMGNRDQSLNTISENGTAGNTQSLKNADQTNTNTFTAGADLGGIKGIDWFAAQNGGQFDPTLFGDYRDSQAAIVGDGDFSGGFFNDAMPVPDFSSPFNWDTFPTMPTGLTPAVQKPNPLEQADMLQAGMEPEDLVSKGQPGAMLDCNKIWDTLQKNPDFQDGNFDIDNLCTELRAKARCSEGGVIVGQHDVDAALKRMPAKQGGGVNKGL